ncbi:MAG: hypothetical protein LBE06_07495 [Azoarcus sp.]|jgi:hypothetical protein|nr:hypothetical protein [Azoarcus sp.]
MSFDDFTDQIEGRLMTNLGWTEIQVADFISPRTRDLIQAYQEGKDVQATAAWLQTLPARAQQWENYPD